MYGHEERVFTVSEFSIVGPQWKMLVFHSTRKASFDIVYVLSA
jgi:hypothetical protein